MSRIDIDIDDELLDRVIQRYGLNSKAEAVDLALRRLADQHMTTEESLAMRGVGAVREIPEDQSPS